MTTATQPAALPASPLSLQARIQRLRAAITEARLMDREPFVAALELLVQAFHAGKAAEVLEEITRAEERMLTLRSFLAGEKETLRDLQGEVRALDQQIDVVEAQLKARAEGSNDRVRQAEFYRLRAEEPSVAALEEQLRERRRRLAMAEGELEMHLREWLYLDHVLANRRLLATLTIRILREEEGRP